MRTEEFIIEADFPVSARSLYQAWLNSEQHSQFTGAPARIEPQLNSKYSAWDDYISGQILDLQEGRRILKSWRSSDFDDLDEDSILELIFTDNGQGCRLTLRHWYIPDGHGDTYREGWQEHYFEPMLAYLSKG